MSKRLPSTQALSELIKHEIDPLLKSKDFKTSGKSYARWSGNFLHRIGFQSSRHTDPSECSFTINLHIALPLWHEIVTGTTFPENIHSSSIISICQTRIGAVVPGKSDRWWSVTPDSDFKVLSHELSHLLRDYGLPFLDRASKPDYLLGCFYANNPRYRRYTSGMWNTLVSLRATFDSLISKYPSCIMQDEAATLFCLGHVERAFEVYNRERQRFQKLMRKPGVSEEIMMESIKEIDQKESILRVVMK